MQTWRSSEKKCYICGLKESDIYSWIVESIGNLPAENWKKDIQTKAKLIEVKREFSRNDISIFYVCFKCMLLFGLEEHRANFRFGFRVPTEKEGDIQEEPVPEEAVKTETTERKEEESGDEKEIQKEGSEEKKEEVKE